MKNILIISPDRWTDHSVSKHHYARTLANLGARVFFLDPPNESAKTLCVVSTSEHKNIWVIRSRKVASGLQYYPRRVRIYLERRWLKKLENKIGYSIDVVWLFENSRFFDMRFSGEKLKIYHQVDLNQRFNQQLSAQTADICFCTTRLILDDLTKYFPKSIHLIHHGLANNYPRSNNAEATSGDRDARVQAAYIGNLDMQYLDVDLLSSLVLNNPEVDFHFVGGFTEGGELRVLCSAHPNITWWGKVDSSKIPEILDRMDVLLVAYQKEHWKDQASPHKFMEYFASGKVIVATYTDVYSDRPDLVQMVDKTADYLPRFSAVISNLDFHNSPENSACRIDFAFENTYEKQVERIRCHLQQDGMPDLLE